MLKHFSAGGLLINSKNEILLIHQTARNEWAFPKGTMEEGEEPYSTAIRELHEETGYQNIELLDKEPFFTDHYMITHPKTGEEVDKTVYYFLFKLTSEEFKQTKEMVDESIEVSWMSIDKALETLTFDNLKEVLKEGRKLLFL